MGEPAHLEAALRELRAALGDEWVRSDAATRAGLALDTRPGSGESSALLLPGDLDGLRSVVAIAGRYGIALHPVSRGRNWGYGGARPPRSDACVLSLERMARIRRFDPELAWIELEPGVSFRGLAEFLAAQPRCFWSPWTGGPDAGSVVGHALARGLGSGWVQDVAATVTGLELLLADGQLVRTGSLDALQGLRPRGLGPDATPLFFQSSLAVVTAMTLQLVPMPARVLPLQFRVQDDRQLAAALERLRPALQSRLWPLELQLFDDVYQLALRGLRAAEAPGPTPLSEATRARLRRRWGGARWAARGALYGEDDEQLGELRRRLAARLDGVVERLRFHPIVDGRSYLQERGDGLALAWWRHPHPREPGQSPVVAGCGLSWLAVAVPQRSETLLAALAGIEAKLHAAGFERALSLRVLDGRSLVLLAPVLFDASKPDEAARAAVCQTELLAALAAAGCHPVRLGIGDEAPEGVRDAGLDARLAAALDPQGLWCRGLYTGR